jgi:hypothetical protein
LFILKCSPWLQWNFKKLSSMNGFRQGKLTPVDKISSLRCKEVVSAAS